MLLVDAGNTRVKWASVEHDALDFSDTGCAARPEEGFQSFADEAWGTLPRPDRVVIANVAGQSFGDKLAAWVKKTWELRAEFVVPQRAAFGIRNAYAEPGKLGVDRWAAMVAAYHHVKGAACVIDCGTAITIDILTKSGEHQGGLIVPGLTMMRHSLVDNTKGILCEAPRASGKPTILARDTQGGVQGGTLYAAVAVIDRVVADVASEIRGEMTCVITGGDAPALLVLLAGAYRHEPDLVLQGLAIIAATLPPSR